eukprot:1463369-Amphidinium_carterae.2
MNVSPCIGIHNGLAEFICWVASLLLICWPYKTRQHNSGFGIQTICPILALLSLYMQTDSVVQTQRTLAQFPLQLHTSWCCDLYRRAGVGKSYLASDRTAQKFHLYRGEIKVCYSAGKTLCRQYLQCLLAFSSGSLDAVPHDQSADIYEKLLAGRTWADLQLSLARVAEADGGGQDKTWAHDREVLPDTVHMGIANQTVLALESGLADPAADHDDTNLDMVDRDAWSDDAEMAESAPKEVALLTHPSERRDEKNAVCGDRAGAPDPLLQMLPLGNWGIWKLGRKKPTKPNSYGGIECVCPLHAKSERSGCKKYIPILGDDDKSVRLAISKAKTWAVAGVEVLRQWEHVFTVPLEPVLPDAELDKRLLHKKPENFNVIDDDTYYLNVGEKPLQQKRARPSGKAKPKVDAI